MKQQVVFLLSLLLVVLASCKNEPKQEAYNPFATPEGCVKEYLDAKDSCDMVRMLKCFSYEAKYESYLREHLQKKINDDARKKELSPEYHYKVDSVKQKGEYPNSAEVAVYYTYGYNKDQTFTDDYTMNLVKDSTNWKIEVRIGLGFSTNQATRHYYKPL